ncbi:MucB/RseB C-terminal domain-containing protein [Idiomarina xiamenensis]|uniref:Negative regulator of sigma E activity n=1 Tax=Idiomarina xiamenensis 10-D-4 TaxID=740709 RepID=K2KQT3_9GAMM|nr:MucB/RseB C-terminal domain-containing protein [Idiomarina xiamenensis]EKE84809.1 negative regulator of sigma E activity [Idiomarina xiamenensis 10-D-4]
MKKTGLWGLVLSTSLLAFSLQAQQTPSAAESTQHQQEEQAGAAWFDKMASALRQQNFDASLVHVQGERVEPFRWLHGRLADDNAEIELLMRLNGPDYRVLRINQRTAYYNRSSSAYSLHADTVYGLIPTAFYQPFQQLAADYRAVPLGGARVIDRNAQHIRLVSRDEQRFGYAIWIDKETGMLLKSAMMSPQGEVVEQIQLTSLRLDEQPASVLTELHDIDLPPLLSINDQRAEPRYPAEAAWLPSGFDLVRGNHHALAVSGVPADHYLYSDGLASFSIYVTPASEEEVASPLALSGADSLYIRRQGAFTIAVVGKLPLETVVKIADNMRIQRHSNQSVGQ